MTTRPEPKHIVMLNLFQHLVCFFLLSADASFIPVHRKGFSDAILIKPRMNIDFDGDTKTDIALYRSSTGAWFYIPSSTNTPSGAGFGGDPSDIPVPGDYDGDRKTDYGIYRLSVQGPGLSILRKQVPRGSTELGLGAMPQTNPFLETMMGMGRQILGSIVRTLGPGSSILRKQGHRVFMEWVSVGMNQIFQ